VKLAISVPDAVFASVETAVHKQGVSRSEFFATAARRYLDELERGSVTDSINEAVALVGDEGTPSPAWSLEAARRTFDREPW
jgi:metal-responsive CopG/Arc/MetJ family transcriptional regulator